MAAKLFFLLLLLVSLISLAVASNDPTDGNVHITKGKSSASGNKPIEGVPVTEELARAIDMATPPRRRVGFEATAVLMPVLETATFGLIYAVRPNLLGRQPLLLIIGHVAAIILSVLNTLMTADYRRLKAIDLLDSSYGLSLCVSGSWIVFCGAFFLDRRLPSLQTNPNYAYRTSTYVANFLYAIGMLGVNIILPYLPY